MQYRKVAPSRWVKRSSKRFISFCHFFSDQRARADNEHGTYLPPRLELAQDEASFNGLTYTNAVGNEQAWTIRPDKPQHRSELIRDEVDASVVE